MPAVSDTGSKLAEAYVRIRGDARDLRGDMNRIRAFLRGNVTGLQRMVSGILRPLRALLTTPMGMLGVAGGAAGMVAITKKLIDLARTQEAAERKLAAVLRTTGHAAGFTAKQLVQYAAELQRTTNFGDEATIAMMSVLATFKEIRGETFKDATKAIQDMSTVMGVDLRSAAIQVGKALNDPVVGATMLRRVGVSLSVQQMEQIKLFTQQNRLMDAQRLILTELESEFGGAAEAMADPITQLGNVIGDIGEDIGEDLLPFVRVLATTVQDKLTTAIDESAASTGEAKTEFQALTEEFGFLGAAILKSADAIQQWEEFFISSRLTLMKMFPAITSATMGIDEANEVLADLESRLVKLTTERLQKPTWGEQLADEVREVREAMDEARGKAEELRQAAIEPDVEPWGPGAPALAGPERSFEALADNMDKLMEKGARVWEKTRTPLERYAAEMQSLLELQETLVINEETFGRAATAAARRAAKDIEREAGARPKAGRGAFTGIRELSRQIQIGIFTRKAEKIQEDQAKALEAIKGSNKEAAEHLRQLAADGIGVFVGGP